MHEDSRPLEVSCQLFTRWEFSDAEFSYVVFLSSVGNGRKTSLIFIRLRRKPPRLNREWMNAVEASADVA